MKNRIYFINQLQVSYLLNIEWHYRITYIRRRRRDCVSFYRKMLESISEARITFDCHQSYAIFSITNNDDTIFNLLLGIV